MKWERVVYDSGFQELVNKMQEEVVYLADRLPSDKARTARDGAGRGCRSEEIQLDRSEQVTCLRPKVPSDRLRLRGRHGLIRLTRFVKRSNRELPCAELRC